MPRFLTDHNFDGRITGGVRRRLPVLDAETVRSLGLDQATDEAILEHAAAEHLVILTHDQKTLVPAAWDRVRRSEPMAGVLVPATMPIGVAVELLAALIVKLADGDWANQVRHLTGDPW